MNTAGVATRMKKGFEYIGVNSDFYSFEQHTYKYENDKLIDFNKNYFIRKFQILFLLVKLILGYKYFIYVSMVSILKNFNEIKLLKFFNKKFALLVTGCDVRMPEIVNKYRWNPCRECTDEYKKFTNCVIEKKKENIRKCENLFDIIYSPIECAGYFKKQYSNIYFPVNISDFPSKKLQDLKTNEKLRLLHAPTNPDYKGSKYVYKAIEELSRIYNFDFKVITGVPIKDLYEEILQSDIIIDQMLVGYYGLFAIESMAMYKPVISYVREDIWNIVKDECPLINSNPDNLYDNLENLLKHPEILTELGMKSRKYVEQFHDSEKIARKILYNFEKC